MFVYNQSGAMETVLHNKKKRVLMHSICHYEDDTDFASLAVKSIDSLL